MGIGTVASILSGGAYFTNGSSQTSSGNLAIGTAAPIGTVLKASVGGNGSGKTWTVSDSKSNTWVLVGKGSNTGASPSEVADYICTVTTALTTSDTCAFGASSTSYIFGNVEKVPGASGSLDGTAVTNSGTTLPIAPGSLTVVVGSLVVCSAAVNDSTGTVSAGSGYTADWDVVTQATHRHGLSVYKIATSTTESPSPTLTGYSGQPWAAVAYALAAAPSFYNARINVGGTSTAATVQINA